MKSFQRNRKYIIAGISLVIIVKAVAAAQGNGNTFTMSEPSKLLDTFKQAAAGWTNTLFTYANRLFGLLLLIEFTYSAITQYLQHQELQSWMAAMIRKVLTLGAFYALLVQGPTWIPAIIDSLQVIGQNVGAGALAPDTIVGHGFNITLNLFSGAQQKNWFTDIVPSLLMVVVGLIVLAAYICIAIQFIVAKIESYIAISAGIIFLGFGGSRWTSSYTERYIGSAVAIGIKLMVIYLIIALGDPLATSWINQAQQIGSQDFSTAIATLFSIATGAVMFAVVCWTIPKLVSSIISGSPSLSGSDLVGMIGFGAGAAVGSAALAAGLVAETAGAAATAGAGAGAGGAGGGGGSAPQSPSQAASLGTVSPGSSPGSTSVTPAVPPPDTSSGSTGSAVPSAANSINGGTNTDAPPQDTTSSPNSSNSDGTQAPTQPNAQGASETSSQASAGQGTSSDVLPEIPAEPVVGPPSPSSSTQSASATTGESKQEATFGQQIAKKAEKAEELLNKARHHINQTKPPHDGGGGGSAPPSMNIGHHE
jgi:type IV secretion system protein TrbL